MKSVFAFALYLLKAAAVISCLIVGFGLHELLKFPSNTGILAAIPAAILYTRLKHRDPWAVVTPYADFFVCCLFFTPLTPLRPDNADHHNADYLFSGLISCISVPLAFLFPYPLLDRTIARMLQTRPPRLFAWVSPFVDHGSRTQPTLACGRRTFP